MAYIDQDSSREKTFSGVIAITLVGAVGYALVTGLAVNVFREPPGFIPGTAYRAPPPPPPPPPPSHQTRTTTAVHPSPTTPVGPDLHPVDTSRIDLGTGPVTIDLGTGAGPVLPPQPPPPTIDRSAGATPRGDPGSWVTSDYYPASAIRAGLEGRTGFRLDVGADGRPTACTIVSSSGSSELDATACRVLMRKARFTPARGVDGNPIASTYSGGVSWKLPIE